jgi:hypothetical protein
MTPPPVTIWRTEWEPGERSDFRRAQQLSEALHVAFWLLARETRHVDGRPRTDVYRNHSSS